MSEEEALNVEEDCNLISSCCKSGDDDLTKAGVTLSWKNVNYVVESGYGFWKCKIRKQKKKLLSNLSGVVPPGRVIAIMGPSGSGKTTFLDALAGRIKAAGLTGEILVNGKKKPSNFKGLSSYVMQDDALIGSLSVRENLLFSALLKLPPSYSWSEKIARVDEVIAELGLTRVQHTKVGTVFFRGVSGGERRRVSIGVELLKKPKLLFLDEPTSGLDSHSSYHIIELMRTIAKKECCTIIMTIHQPSSSVFRLFDGLMLLSKGELIYYGPASQTAEFFADQGHAVPPFVNPADHFLEVINYDFQVDKPEVISNLVEAYKVSSQGQQIQNAISALDSDEQMELDKHLYPKYGTNPFVQTTLLTARMLLQYLRDPAVYWGRIFMYSFLAIMMGTLYLQIDDDPGSIQDRLSVLFFSIAFLSFMSVSALPAFVEDRKVFVRERMNGTYSVFPYAVAQVLVSVPFVCIIALMFTAISYYMIMLNPGPGHFFIFMGVLALALNVAESLIVAISAVVPSFIFGLAAGAGSFGAFMLVCGFFLLKKNIPDYWIWLHYLSFQKYGFESLMVRFFILNFSFFMILNPNNLVQKNEFSGQSFPCDKMTVEHLVPSTGEYIKVTQCNCAFPDLDRNCEMSGDEILTFYEYEDVHIWAWCLVLVGMIIFFRFLFFVFLRFFNKGNR